jgi:drug/metabolite transporter (DMT)-like permease
MKGYFYIASSGILYGTIPIFATYLSRYEVSTIQQVILRIAICLVVFLIYNRLNPNSSLRLKSSDYKHFGWFGLVGIALFFMFYLSSAVLVGVATAVLLLYTQPVYTLILSALLLKEKISIYGILAAVLSLVGVIVIVQIWDLKQSGFSFGHVCGLLSGLGYSIYIIFMRKFAGHKHYPSLTITFWSFLSGLIWLLLLWPVFMVIFSEPEISAISLPLDWRIWLFLLGFALLPTLFAYLLFNRGIATVQSHRAGLMVLLEPVSAVLMGWLLLNQTLKSTDLAGGVLIISALLILQFDRAKADNS